jgi:hypothetical protein
LSEKSSEFKFFFFVEMEFDRRGLFRGLYGLDEEYDLIGKFNEYIIIGSTKFG